MVPNKWQAILTIQALSEIHPIEQSYKYVAYKARSGDRDEAVENTRSVMPCQCQKTDNLTHVSFKRRVCITFFYVW